MSKSPSPALSESELSETLDMIATVVASVSDRVDTQTEVLGRVHKTATEARQASFAAMAHTDPERFGDLVGETIEGRVNDSLLQLGSIADVLMEVARMHQSFAEGLEGRFVDQRKLWEREERADRFKRRLPWFGLGAVVLVVALSVALPRFMASYASTCAVMGGSWIGYNDGEAVCRIDGW